MIKTSCIFDFEMEYLFVNFFCRWNSVTVVFNTSQRKQICNHLLRYRWTCSFFSETLKYLFEKDYLTLHLFYFWYNQSLQIFKTTETEKNFAFTSCENRTCRFFRPSLYFVSPTPFLRIGSLTFFWFLAWS